MSPSSRHPYWDSQDIDERICGNCWPPILIALQVHVGLLYRISLFLLGLLKHRSCPSGCKYEGDIEYDTL